MTMILSVLILFGQWSTPVNLGIAGVEDKYPQAYRRQLMIPITDPLWMVWQAYRGGDWEIYSRQGGAGSWSDTLRVTNNNTNDLYPCVAYDGTRNCCWCAWQNDSGSYSDICVARTYPWSSPVKITNDATADQRPSITVIGSTVWVSWRRGNDIYSSSYNGTTWTTPVSVATGVTNSRPKISVRSGHPIVVWERYETAYPDIYYSEYISNAWQAPQAITSDPAVDARPEIAMTFYTSGIYVYWHSNRDGNYEIYRTACDTLNINYRVTYNDSTEVDPCPLMVQVPIRQYEPDLAYMSTRKGNSDIYFLWGGSTVPVDTNPAADSFPVMTADRRVYTWILWQTNRNGNSDIYGSYWYSPGGVSEYLVNRQPQIEITPNPFHDRVAISLGKNIRLPVKIQIYDAAGKAVKNIPLPTACVKIPIIITWNGTTDDGNAASPGIYFVLIKSSEAIYAGKIIKLY